MEPTTLSPPKQAEKPTHVIDAVRDAVVIVDTGGNITFANAAAELIFDRPASEMPGRPLSSLLAEPFQAKYAEAVQQWARGDEPELLATPGEVMGQRGEEGETIALELTLNEMRDGENRLLVAVARDMRAQKKSEAQLRHQAEHDALTGLPNRTSFEQILTRHVEYAARYGNSGSVATMGIDNFKYVNDTLGHEAGDQLLKEIAGLIKGRLRNTDILGRLSGDVFAALLHGAGASKAQEVAEGVVQLIESHTFALQGEGVRVTMSAGLTALQERPVTGAELLAEADIAMYQAKEEGRNKVVVFEQDGREGIETKRIWSERIRQATERGLFVLVCQPIVDLKTDQVSHYELLLRMRGEDGGLVPPGAFLATAERFGLIQGVDRWVAQQAMRLIAAHKQKGQDLVLGVNVSGKTTDDADFLERIEKDLKTTGIDPAQLIFEITETTAVNNIDRARAFAETLLGLGCKVALDDFGAGFASFFYLKHLPFSYLKIDGEFVKELARAPIDQLIVKSLVDVCKGRKILTVAEFVEDKDTLDALKRLDVDYAQGYYLGRPAPIAELQAPSE
jgi:diguanylate cyclase (GGDEF)-like protein/PAS domain S-box-containing protein